MPDAPKTPNTPGGKGGQGAKGGQGSKGGQGGQPANGAKDAKDAKEAKDTKDGGTAIKAREVRTLHLVKGQQRFCFRYELGDEPKVLDALVEMVGRRELSFDWFDAAVLSHQLGQHLAKELKGFLPKKAA
jgi:hypothetical protein